ncbi:uncharacterized protein LOC141714387 [Apium graveolens]|uniref:uncharacterized protein LOC141714387 n=1 Tax=Apium graveolens TaxID=4045 RepID=UPI003D7AF044
MPCPEMDAPVYRDAPSNAGMEVEDPRDFDFDLDPRIPMPAEKTGPAEGTISVLVDKDDPSKVLKVGSQLSYEMREKLIYFLVKNLDVFRRPVIGERAIALKEEVDQLLEVGLIKESFYPEWLANPVLVKKPNGKWRTCVDFIDLNKACPKDSFPLPRIDQLVDAMVGHVLLSFMDAYSGYNQIPMYGPDQEHTSFITDRGLYCYVGMPFGLINAGATYQRLVNMMFKNQIGRTMEVYMDDMLVKSKEANYHVKHLMEMFNILKRFRMKLNPQKCMFGVESVLLREEDSQQSPVCYVRKRIHDAETRYTSMEKLVYALILASRKLCPYFQAHRIEVRTTYPLRQALADFLLEFDSAVDDKALVVLCPHHIEEFLEEIPHPWWILHVDGAVNNGGAGAWIVLVSPEGHHLMSAIHFKFYATNNDAEYEALINGLKIALEMGVRNLIAKSD